MKKLEIGPLVAAIDAPVSAPVTDDVDDDENGVDDAVEAVGGMLSGQIQLDSDGVLRHTLTLEKQSGRQLSDAKMDAQVATIIQGALIADRVKRGWSARVADESDARYRRVGSPDSGYVYAIDVAVECRPSRLRRTFGLEFANIASAMHAKGASGKMGWRVASTDGTPYVPMDASRIVADPSEELGYAPFELPIVKHPYDVPCPPECDCFLSNFQHLYGLEDYIETIHDVLELAVMSEWQTRVNIALIGPPACGKSELCKAVRKAVGSESVLEYDATSTSMAGAQNELGNLEELPRVLVLEEIEKAPESALPWLLSVLDLRGEVRKTTARANIEKSVHMVGICTVNDEAKFRSVASGALASRFSMPLHFSRPPREILWKILKREVDKVGGDVAWIEPALDFAEALDKDKTGVIDPRKLIAICLTGREKLIDGRFQERYMRTMPRAVEKAAKEAAA